jgi:hypothetical protein
VQLALPLPGLLVGHQARLHDLQLGHGRQGIPPAAGSVAARIRTGGRGRSLWTTPAGRAADVLRSPA